VVYLDDASQALAKNDILLSAQKEIIVPEVIVPSVSRNGIPASLPSEETKREPMVSRNGTPAFLPNEETKRDLWHQVSEQSYPKDTSAPKRNLPRLLLPQKEKRRTSEVRTRRRKARLMIILYYHYRGGVHQNLEARICIVPLTININIHSYFKYLRHCRQYYHYYHYKLLVKCK